MTQQDSVIVSLFFSCGFGWFVGQKAQLHRERVLNPLINIFLFTRPHPSNIYSIYSFYRGDKHQSTIWWSDSLIVNLEVLFATLLEKLFWGFQWSRGSKLWPNNTVNTKFCVRTFLGAFNNQNCWNCQHSHHHEVFSHFFPFCISICMLYDRLKTL